MDAGYSRGRGEEGQVTRVINTMIYGKFDLQPGCCLG